jgi:hypothetical protein
VNKPKGIKYKYVGETAFLNVELTGDRDLFLSPEIGIIFKTSKNGKNRRMVLPRVVYSDLDYQTTQDGRRVLGQSYASQWEIVINENATDKQKLMALIHESVHLAMPGLAEVFVHMLSEFISEILWRERYRKTDDADRTAASY